MTELSGKLRLRHSWGGKLVLQVQESYNYAMSGEHALRGGSTGYRWRDAKVTDLPASLELAEQSRKSSDE